MALVSLQQFLEDMSFLIAGKPAQQDAFVTKHRPVLDEF
jgi:hypothetical protein